MVSRTLLLALLAACLLLRGPAGAQDGLPATAGFETGEGAFARWTAHTWEPAGSPRSRTAVDDAVAHTGKASLRAEGSGAASQGYWNAPPMPASPGRRYVATVWVRAELSAGAGLARLQMGFRDKSGEVVVAEGKPWYEGWVSAPVTGVREWVQTGVAAKAPEGAATVHISVKLIGIGTAWFDDAALDAGDAAVPAPPPALASESRLALASPVSGADPAAAELKNPYAEPLSDLHVSLSGPVAAEARLDALAPGAAARVALPFRAPAAEPRERARFEARIAYTRAGRRETERILLFADVLPAALVEAVRTGQEAALPEKASGEAPTADLLGLATGPAGGRAFLFPSAPTAADTLVGGFALVVRVANPTDQVREVSLSHEVLDYFWRGETGARKVRLAPHEARFLPIEVTAAQGARIRQAAVSARAEVFRATLTVDGRAGQRDVKVTPPAEKREALPALPERRSDVPPFGALRLVDEVECGNPADPHALREGAKGLYTKGTSEPLDHYDGKRLTYEWQGRYRDRRERFAEVREVLGRPCRVADDWGWFGFYVGRGQLKSGRYYVAAIEYPEDAPRTFCVWNTLDTRASFGFHTGSSLGDPFTRQRFIERSPYPLSGGFGQWRSLFRSATDGSGWIFIHSMGDRADPYSEGVAVSHLRLYEVGGPEELERLAVRPAVPLPPDLPRRRLVFLQEDASAAAACLPELQFLGFDTYSPLALSYAGGTYATNSGYIDWPSKLFGRGEEPVRNPHARANPAYYIHKPSPTRYEGALAAAKARGIGMLPCLEYAGTGRLPEEALAVDPDGQPARYYWGGERLPDGTYRPRRLQDGTCIDMAHPAVGEDLCRLIDEVAGAYAKEYPNLAGIQLTHRFNAWQISYSDYEMDRFARETGIAVAGAGQKERAAWILANRAQEYLAFHTAKKRENLLKARDRLRRIRPNLTLYVLNWVGGDDCLPFGGILWFQGREKGDEFLLPGKPFLMEKGRRPLAALLEDTTRPDVRMQSVPLHPRLYEKDEGILNWAVGHYRFTADDPAYLGAFRTGTGVAFCDWWIYNEDCYNNNPAIGWNCPGLHGTEHAGRFCMTEEVCAVAAADPVVVGIRMGFINRGFPEHARRFAAAYRALPALPSVVVNGAFPDPEVVVRHIPTRHGDYYAVADRRLSLEARAGSLRLPAGGKVVRVVNLATGEEIPFRVGKGSITLAWRSEAMSLSALRVEYGR